MGAEPNALAGSAASTAQEPLRATALRDRHVALGARMIPFAGWLMPVQYGGIMQEHRAVRSAAGLFDLGHMGQVGIGGPGAADFLQRVTTNDVAALAPGAAHYSLLPNEGGGVVDDIIVYRRPEADGPTSYFVVTNASNHDKDLAWLRGQAAEERGGRIEIEDLSPETGMIAIQGPRAEAIVQGLTDAPLAALGPFRWTAVEVAAIPAMIARTGYTGEDGFEFYVANDRSGELWDALLAAGGEAGLTPVGLGARDTLRLEARMPLYGNELADDISPLEAGLGWAVRLDKGPFVGREAMAAMKERGAPRRTVGFKLAERSGAPRHGYAVTAAGRPAGHVTSGAFSPTLGENIGLALVDREVAGVGRPLEVVVRDRAVPAVQVKLPFYRRPGAESARTSAAAAEPANGDQRSTKGREE